jgi:hypothetical protein
MSPMLVRWRPVRGLLGATMPVRAPAAPAPKMATMRRRRRWRDPPRFRFLARAVSDDRRCRVSVVRAVRHSSMPERPGNIQSSTTRSGVLSSAVSASSPQADVSTRSLPPEVVTKQHRQRLLVFDDQDARVLCAFPLPVTSRAHRSDRRGIAFRPLVGNRTPDN